LINEEKQNPIEQVSGVVSVTPNVKKKIFGRRTPVERSFGRTDNRTDRTDRPDRMERTPFERKGEEQRAYQDTKANRNKLKIMFFGGVGEVGKNMTAFCYGDDIIIVDCGVAFPDEGMPGVDLVVPDMTYLKNNAQKIKGIVITHAHEDHIGSLPYFLDDVKATVYGSRLTVAMIENKLREFPKVKMTSKIVKPHDVVKIGCFQVEFIHVNHSIAGSHALAIKTPVGMIVHSGDFKIDFTPIIGETTDLSRLGEL